MADKLSAQLNATPGCIPAKWSRSTIADGDWLQAKTLNPYSSRDNWLAEKIEELSGKSDEDLEKEIQARIAGDTYLSGAIVSISSDFYPFSANVEASAAELNTKIDNETTRATNKEGELNAKISNTNTRIDNLEAATDVIAVFGTYEEFTAASAGAWQQTVTDNDFIKVIRDDNYQPNQNDPDYQTTDDDVYQVYYEYHKTNHDGWIGWSAIGSLDPYYSVNEIDDKETELSSTIANTYLSANGTDISAGKNLDVVIQSNNPRVAFKTKDNVTFDGVSSTTLSATTAYGSSAKFDNISATTVTALTATGNSAKFTNISATNISADLFKTSDLGTVETWQLNFGVANGSKLTATEAKAITLTAGTLYGQSNNSNVDSLIGSAQSGKFAWDVINSAKFSAVGTTTSTAYLSGGFAIKAGDNLTLTYANKTITLNAGDTGITAISAGNTKYTGPVFSASAGTGINFVNGNNNVLGIKASDTLINSATGGSAAYNWITGQSATLQAGPGIGFYSAGPNLLGISAEGTTYQEGDYVKIDDTTKKIDLSTTGIKTSAYSAEFINGADHYNSILNGDSLYFGYGHSTLNISLTGVSYYGGGSQGSTNWDNLFKNYAQVNRERISDSNLTADKVNFIVATGTSDAYKAVNFVVTSTLPTVLSANTYYIV